MRMLTEAESNLINTTEYTVDWSDQIDTDDTLSGDNGTMSANSSIALKYSLLVSGILEMIWVVSQYSSKKINS